MIVVVLVLIVVATALAQSTLETTLETTSTTTSAPKRTCFGQQKRTVCIHLPLITCPPGRERKEFDWSTDADGCPQCPRVECHCPTCAGTPPPCANGKKPDVWNTTDDSSGKEVTRN
jgi:hypothetical protein